MERTRLRTAHSERTGDVARRSNYADVRGWENAPLPDAQRRAFFNLIKKAFSHFARTSAPPMRIYI